MIFQNVAQTLLLLKADTSDLKAKLKDLTAEEKKAAQASISLVEAQNKRYEGLAKAITGVNVVTETATKAVQMFGQAWKDYEKAAMAAGGADAEKARSFRQAMDHWSQATDRASIAVGRLVANLAPLVDALASLVDLAGGLVQAAGQIGDTFLGGSFDPGTEFTSLTAGTVEERMRRAIDTLNGNSTQIKAAVAADSAESALRSEQWKKSLDWGKAIQKAQKEAGPKNYEEVLASLAAGLVSGSMPFDSGIDPRFSGTSVYTLLKDKFPDAKKPKRKRGNGDNAITWDEYYSNTSGVYDGWGGNFGDGTSRGTGPFGMMVGAPTAYAGIGGFGSADWEDTVAAIQKNVAALETDRKQSVIERIFGEPKEFDAYAAKFQMLSDAVGVFSGALQSGFDAWISGSASAKEALAGVFKATISGLASTMFAHALEEGALAVGAVARGIGGNPQGFVEAAAHGKAAAAYGAAGVGIGAIARQFAGGGASAGAGAGGGGGGAPYVGGDHRSGGGGGTTVVYVGEGWSTTPGQQRQQTARSYRAARRELAGAAGVRDL